MLMEISSQLNTQRRTRRRWGLNNGKPRAITFSQIRSSRSRPPGSYTWLRNKAELEGASEALTSQRQTATRAYFGIEMDFRLRFATCTYVCIKPAIMERFRCSRDQDTALSRRFTATRELCMMSRLRAGVVHRRHCCGCENETSALAESRGVSIGT
jgi:hypothetical protein